MGTQNTLQDAGSIIGDSGTAIELNNIGSTGTNLLTGRNLLVVDPGAVIDGLVVGNVSASNMIELSSAASAGSLSGLGTQFTNFGSISFDAGAKWFISGNTSGLAGTIGGFADGDTIQVTGITATGSAYAGGVLTLTEASGQVTLSLPGDFSTEDFAVTNVTEGVDVSLVIPCFCAGTRIRAPRGEVAIENLRVEDRVRTISGQAQPIEWIGRRRVDCRRHAAPDRVRPIRIAPHAFGENRPKRVLLLSPDHSVFVEDVLIPIKFLVNGSTVAQIDIATVTYYHLELPRHDVVLAEGLPTESYLETGGRSAFQNGGGAMQAHPDFTPDEARVAMLWQTFGYAPLIGTDGQVDRVRARLVAQSLMLGYRPDGTPPQCARRRAGP